MTNKKKRMSKAEIEKKIQEELEIFYKEYAKELSLNNVFELWWFTIWCLLGSEEMKIKKGTTNLKHKDGTSENSRYISIINLDGNQENCKHAGQAILDWINERKQKWWFIVQAVPLETFV